MRLILLGAPGSGKGTQGPLLAGHFGAMYVSSGELLRRHVAQGTPLGKEVEGFMRAGELVPDELVLELLLEPIGRAVADGGYVLDGFPRTLRQAELAFLQALPLGATADAVVYLSVPDEIVRRRLAGRAVEGRADDNARVIERRLQIFHSQTEPLLEYYANRGLLRSIEATGAPDAVTAEVIAALDHR